MTALAMIIGMAPMALGLGEGGEQNAPLGRAVIGGLIFATIATLIFVPVVFSVIHRNHGKTAQAAPAGARTESPCRLSPLPHAGTVSRRGLALAGIVAVPGRRLRRRERHLEPQRQRAPGSRRRPTRRRCRRSRIISPSLGGNKSSLDLPGRLEAYSRAPIYARVSGFLKAWYVDIGAPVKAGQLLAEIEAPDLDQQLLQARAALASAAGRARRWPRSPRSAGRRWAAPTPSPSRPSTRRPATSPSSRR